MSDPLAARFSAWRTSKHTALIPYITAGYPAPSDTLDVLLSLVSAGADIIELGVPFSDPVADGPTIQRASQAALEQGATLQWTLAQLREFRKESDTPVVLFSYLNPVFTYGVARFIDDALGAGANGVLFTDLPMGGDDVLEQSVEASPLALIRLIAPTTKPDRAAMIAERAQGFLYYIARTGVTGARTELPTGLREDVLRLRERTTNPICVGFGISTPGQARAVAEVADGVVIGSALIDALERGGKLAAVDFLAGIRQQLP